MPRRAPFAAFAVLAALTLTGGVLPASAEIVSDPIEDWVDENAFSMSPIGSYGAGPLDEGVSEIVAHHPATQRVFVINALAGLVEAISIADPTTPTHLFDIEISGVEDVNGDEIPEDASANSVAVRPDGLGAVAVQSDPKTDDGWVVFFDAAGTGDVLGAVRAGALPDMVTFTPDGSHALVANEGEPEDDYSVDPQGTVSVIAVPSTVALPVQSAVSSAGFLEYEATGSTPADPTVRVFGTIPGTLTPFSDSTEPEYITVSDDSSTAFVTLQEANAIAVVDVASATVTDVHPLGFKDWSTSALDPSDRDDAIAIAPWPVFGMYQPDSLGHVTVGGATFLVTANEGDSRDWDGYSEIERVKDLDVCDSFDADALEDEALGRLNVTTTLGYDEDAACYDELYTFGGRSFSVWTEAGALAFDSGDLLEQLIARVSPEFFNSNSTASNFDSRSDDKGPEPEGLAIGEVAGVPYLFLGLERVGGIAVFDLTNPAAPGYVGYLNNRDFAVSAEDDGLTGAGDLGPEGLAFIAAADSPTGEPLLAVGNEISGSTTLYSIAVPDSPAVLAHTGATVPTGLLAGVAGLVVLGAALLLVRRRSLLH